MRGGQPSVDGYILSIDVAGLIFNSNGSVFKRSSIDFRVLPDAKNSAICAISNDAWSGAAQWVDH